MKIIWDPDKAKSNFRKHRIHFSDAESVLYDPMALTLEDHDVKGEKRFVTVGTDSMGRIVVAVYTYRGDNIRLISARKATPSERKYYEEGI
ncbi:MAG: BrnT family toxin [Proteobacteria bacterium]|nr:BrnT family toxin [Desulfobacterales bacterium]MBL6968133.1 BrnT family toxin [Desulfobacteraceae bacterium]MBU0733508.1 BrnT family toxin [Pseudomonadota bacterium]MBL7101827.1 BrnT family toxin [Desulfobacteraceae bacterium]MBL7172376.1 BrnT family toxin [Desulfobacteraceae bacterium]